jgi:hypothetical protein
MNTYWEVEVCLHLLTSAVDGSKSLASRLDSFNPWGKILFWIGVWVEPRAGLDAVAK